MAWRSLHAKITVSCLSAKCSSGSLWAALCELTEQCTRCATVSMSVHVPHRGRRKPWNLLPAISGSVCCCCVQIMNIELHPAAAPQQCMRSFDTWMPLCFENMWQPFSNCFNERTSGLQLEDIFSLFLQLYGLCYGMWIVCVERLALRKQVFCVSDKQGSQPIIVIVAWL